jgi:eukaryotic-like serine/threonine-protein kinase
MMHELQPGDPELIGPYRLRGRLGTGGMGQVFLGVSAGGRPVAVKVVRAHLATDPEFRERFRREIAVARKVSGVYTSPVIDADVDGPMPWLATAYVEGPSLADAVMANGPLAAGSVLALAKGLAEGLNAIHAAGVVHRDLKPANVLLAADGPRVIDFGISRATEASALTHTGLVVGSPGFMSPEQAEGRVVGPPSDIFSLGAVLAFAATGHGPFGAGSTPALVYRVVYSPPNLNNLPAEVRPLIERCLVKDPAQRPTAAQLLAEAGGVHPATAWLPVTRTSVQVPAVTPQGDTEPGLSRPGAVATRLDSVRPYAPPTMTAAVLSSPAGPTRRQAGLGQPARHTRHRAWRPIAVVSISAGLLAGCTYTGMALTSGSGHTMSPATSTPTPSVSASTSAPATVTPTTSMPTTSVPTTSAPVTSAPVTPSSTPTVTVSPSASVSPTVITSASPSPTVTLTTTAPANTPTSTTTAPAPTTPTPVTTTAAP